jgi:hypothetical protein
MRTTIEIDEQLLNYAMQLTGIKSKSKIVDLALRTFIEIEERKRLIPSSPSPPTPSSPAPNSVASPPD